MQTAHRVKSEIKRRCEPPRMDRAQPAFKSRLDGDSGLCNTDTGWTTKSKSDAMRDFVISARAPMASTGSVRLSVGVKLRMLLERGEDCIVGAS